jgi:diguanylate cyclase (GGDEF)-like protein
MSLDHATQQVETSTDLFSRSVFRAAARSGRSGHRSLLTLSIGRRLALGFLIPILVTLLALGSIGLQSHQLLSNVSAYHQHLLHASSSLTTASDTLQQTHVNLLGALNDADNSQTTSETLREDQVTIEHLEQSYATTLRASLQQDDLDQNPALAPLLDQAGHAAQIDALHTRAQETLSVWQTYQRSLTRVFAAIATGNLSRAHSLEATEVEQAYAEEMTSLRILMQSTQDLVPAIHDATSIEENQLLLVMTLSALSLLAGIALVAWLVSTTIVGRLQQFRSVVLSVEQGQFAARVAVEGRDEIALVSQAVNTTLDTIVGLLEETRHQHEELAKGEELKCLHEALQHEHEALNTANARLEALATTDALTELPNHRSLVSTLEQELERAHRYSRSCSILFLDIDHFKALNDGYGHASGDTVLHEFAGLIRTRLRLIDTAGRWGGEEFVAILPEMTIAEAQIFAEDLRVDVAAHLFSVGGGSRLTCSIGVACYPTHASGREDLINAADQAMYAAKRLGRDQVRRVDDPLVQTLLLEKNEEGGRDESALAGIVAALSRLMEAHDPSIGQHSLEVSELLPGLTQNLGLPIAEAQMIALAGRLHDIGKISLPTSILHNPGRLTEEEWAMVRTHPVTGAEVVSSIPVLRPLASVIRAHHERWDGQGYPDQLAGKAIPFGARIIAVANAYMAMTVERPYQPARSQALALAELKRCAGSQFDPQMVDAIESLLLSDQLMTEIVGVA